MSCIIQSASSAVHCVLITSTEARAALKLLFEVHYLYSNRLNAKGRDEKKKKIGQELGKNCIVTRLAVRQLVVSVQHCF